jgi:VanZ family protein
MGIGVIAIESTPYFGSDRTSGPLRWLWEEMFGAVNNGRWLVVHHVIRKAGHFVGYGIMGLLWLRAWWLSMPRAKFLTACSLALLGTFTVASADELHQSFLPNRTGLFSDVLLDCCGALLSLLIAYAYLRIRTAEGLARAA